MTKHSGIFLLIFIILVSCDSQESADDRPNILFIMADDHTAQALLLYRSVLDSVVQAPNLSRLQDEEAKLTRVLATNYICTPSRATILTGQYSQHNGVYTLADTLKPNKKT